jgi:hypothetical protein
MADASCMGSYWTTVSVHVPCMPCCVVLCHARLLCGATTVLCFTFCAGLVCCTVVVLVVQGL